ncbi:hypothetical protein NQ318_022351 [Aromia moschata]|uniref:Uncharacterized protein n=1 Tax=Aromia moschata TaxID=1265417 RepID=A0AAV8Z793_9CUCU|nr:hypothetical protein NQ318_022351 [Aromia moschata]
MADRSVLIDENDSLLNFCISDTVIKKPKLHSKFTSGIMSEEEFAYHTGRLYKYCLKPVRDMHQLHKNRIMGMKIIDHLILKADSSYISIPHVMRIIWSVMSCIHHFQLRLRTGTIAFIHYSRKRTTEKCLKSYSRLIRIFHPSMHRIILNAILVFYKEGKLWEFEFACTDLIVDLMMIYTNFEQALDDILNVIETVGEENVTEARYLIQVLYEVLRKVQSPVISEPLVNRFLSMLESSIVPKITDRFNYGPLRRGIELCIMNTIAHLSLKGLFLVLKKLVTKMAVIEDDEAMLLNLGNLAAYAAGRYRPKTFRHYITQEIFDALNVLNKKPQTSAVSVCARIWHNLLDRNNNLLVFSTPRIYLQDCNYKINIKECVRGDKIFFKEWRTVIYDLVLVNCRMVHGLSQMEGMFQLMAVSLSTIPCGYTASTYVSAALSVQDYAFQISKENLVKSHHLHAIVLSIMSLVCYVHKAEVFYEYVNSIMERRAEWAPHLNPPLKLEYQYAQHHILWNRPDLFFEDWETRYGLWKCFRVKIKHPEGKEKEAV